MHFFWGSFDLAVTRFSGRTAPRHPGGVPRLPDAVVREAYSHEVSSAGFWPGGGGVIDEPAFYSYAYPAPAGFADASVKPAEAYFHQAAWRIHPALRGGAKGGRSASACCWISCNRPMTRRRILRNGTDPRLNARPASRAARDRCKFHAELAARSSDLARRDHCLRRLRRSDAGRFLPAAALCRPHVSRREGHQHRSRFSAQCVRALFRRAAGAAVDRGVRKSQQGRRHRGAARLPPSSSCIATCPVIREPMQKQLAEVAGPLCRRGDRAGLGDPGARRGQSEGDSRSSENSIA